jgi:hypothetical protein
MNILTTLAVEKRDHSFNPQLYYLTNDSKRITYWKCCATFFSTSIRCNPRARHILYTNDLQPVQIGKTDIKQFLMDLGVEIRYFTSKGFVPPARFSTFHTPTFYKLAVIKDLVRQPGQQYLILDSDCIWTRPDQALNTILASGKILPYDVYSLTDPDKKVHGISRRDLGTLFRRIDPGYPDPAPVWYGGEIIAGSSENLQLFIQKAEETFRYVIDHFPVAPTLPNGKKIFDGEEYLTSFVYNTIPERCIAANGFIRRIWSSKELNNVQASDLDIPIWHMIGEKMQGIPVLFEEVVNPASAFWSVPLADLSRYLGGYVGVPRRIHNFEEPSSAETFLPKVISKLRQLVLNKTAALR